MLSASEEGKGMLPIIVTSYHANNHGIMSCWAPLASPCEEVLSAPIGWTEEQLPQTQQAEQGKRIC